MKNEGKPSEVTGEKGKNPIATAVGEELIWDEDKEERKNEARTWKYTFIVFFIFSVLFMGFSILL